MKKPVAVDHSKTLLGTLLTPLSIAMPPAQYAVSLPALALKLLS